MITLAADAHPGSEDGIALAANLAYKPSFKVGQAQSTRPLIYHCRCELDVVASLAVGAVHDQVTNGIRRA